MNYTDAECIAALQSITIYVVLRISQTDEIQKARDDVPMIHAMGVC